ncbi:MAG: hypothetical protein FWD75_07090 [Propionibacteriaceae bacterium]|nr:hypothetical protein [Propionibacteriaceae bacterium]
MDIPAVLAMMAKLAQGAQTLQSVMSSLTKTVQTTSWTGADYNSFLSSWQGEHAPAMANTIAGLESAAQSVRRSAEAQQNASAAK